ncbi:MAG: T9SS type A sorting domain-containing protein [Bacteroidetes bacterium]|nr:T9SS type A sorting domain-containing protein [Bacteroidota bacterium]MBS1630059.1 T9SS type A sorting domain-containing protein [Bacteroidota bacterium]
MKPLTHAILGLIAILPLTTMAQNTTWPELPKTLISHHQSVLRQSIEPQLPDGTTPGKTGAWSVRLLSSFSGNGTSGAYQNSDSAYYTYSGDRGGSLSTPIQCDTNIQYSWDTTTNVWIPSSQTLYFYNAQDFIIKRIILDWESTSSSYTKIELDTYIYNSQGLLINSLVTKWNPSTSAWENWSQYTNYTYNAAKQILSYVAQVWEPSTSSWDNAIRYTNTFDGSGNRTTALTEYWNAGTATWSNQYLYTITYNASNLVTSIISQYWQVSALAWRNSNYSRSYYNGAGALVSYAYSGGDGTGLGWINIDSLNNSPLNAAGEPLITTYYSWNASVWQLNHQITFTYSGSLETSRVRASWNGSAFVNNYHVLSTYAGSQLKEERSETYNSGSWIITSNDNINRYHYQFGLSVPEITASGLQWIISPNPADAALTLQWKQARNFSIVVYDMAGRQVQHQEINSSSSFKLDIPTNNLTNGIYILKVTSGASQSQQRFVVKH